MESRGRWNLSARIFCFAPLCIESHAPVLWRSLLAEGLGREKTVGARKPPLPG